MTFEPTEPQNGVDPNMFTLIDPDAIPYPLTDVWSLNYAAQTLRTGGEDLFGGAEDMSSTWRGLQAHYVAPESETLFAKMDPVVDRGEDIESDLATVATALEDLAEAAKTAQGSLNLLRIDAQGFWNRHHDEKVWWLTEDEETDQWALEENIRIKDAVNAAWATFNEAENDCASRISAVFGGPAYVSPGQGSGDDTLVYGLPPDAGERDLSLERALSFEGMNSTFNDVTAWAGTEFHPSQMDWGNDAGQAVWDVVVTDALWGSAVGVVSKLGYWHPDNGWRFDREGRWDNATAAWNDARMDASALIGIHDDQGWVWESPDEGPTGWDRWFDNLDASKDEVWEGHTSWSTRDDGPEGVDYSDGTIGANAVMLTAGLPLKAVKLILGAGVDGSGGMPSPDSEGSDSEGSGASTSRGGPGTGEWPSSPLPQRPGSDASTTERFENPLTVLQESLLDPNQFRPTPSGQPDTPSPTPTPETGGDRPSPKPRESDTPPQRPGDEDSPRRPGEDDTDAPRGPEQKPEAPTQPSRPESEAPRGEERPPHRDEDDEGEQSDGPVQNRGDDQGGTEGPREESERPEPATGGGGGGDEPPRDRTGTGGDDEEGTGGPTGEGDVPSDPPQPPQPPEKPPHEPNGDDGDDGEDDGGDGGDPPRGGQERLLDVFPNRVDTEGLLPRPDQTKPPTGRVNPRPLEEISDEGLVGPGWEHFNDKEKGVAEYLREHGIEVVSIKETTVNGVRTPEAAISGTGETVEFKVLESDGARSFERNIRSARGQSRRMVFDVRHLGTSQEDAVERLGKGLFNYGGDLSEVVVIGDGYTIVWP